MTSKTMILPGLLAAFFAVACGASGESSASSDSAVTVSGCHTDGCVFRKQAELNAVVERMRDDEDDCPSIDVWPWAIEALNDTDYAWTCGYSWNEKGHTSAARRVVLRVDSSSGEAIAVTKVSAQAADTTSFPFSNCTSDGCVGRKNSEARAILEWANTHDDCSSAVGWLQAYKQVGNIDYELTCGDAAEPEKMLLRIANAGNWEHASEIEVTRLE